MVREVREDFCQLLTFVREYKVTDIANVGARRVLLSSIHKPHLAVLVVVAEMEDMDGTWPELSEIALTYGRETASDLSSAVFCWIHGAYQPARFALRSAIENHIKASLALRGKFKSKKKFTRQTITDFNSITEFRANPLKERAETLVQSYSELCKDVHTATKANMAQLPSLGSFPNYDRQSAESFVAIFRNVVRAIIVTNVSQMPNSVHGMHYRNSTMVLAGLSPSDRKVLMGG